MDKGLALGKANTKVENEGERGEERRVCCGEERRKVLLRDQETTHLWCPLCNSPSNGNRRRVRRRPGGWGTGRLVFVPHSVSGLWNMRHDVLFFQAASLRKYILGDFKENKKRVMASGKKAPDLPTSST